MILNLYNVRGCWKEFRPISLKGGNDELVTYPKVVSPVARGYSHAEKLQR